MLAVELPIAERRRRRAGPGPRPHPRHRRPAPRRDRRTGCGSAAGCPTRATGRRATRRSSIATRRACPSCSEPASASDRDVAAGPRRPVAASGRLVSRACLGSLALVAAPGCSAARRRSRGPRRHAGPDDRQRTPATTSSRPSTRPGDARPDADQPPQGHDDQALLLRPGVPGRPARRVGLHADAGPARGRRGRRLEADHGLHAPRLDLGARLYSGKSATTGCASTSSTGGAATRDLRDRRFARVVPGLGFATDSTPGELGHGRLPGGLRVEVEAGDDPGARPPTPTGRIDLPDRHSSTKPLDVLRLSRRRPAGRLRRDGVVTADGRRKPGRS